MKEKDILHEGPSAASSCARLRQALLLASGTGFAPIKAPYRARSPPVSQRPCRGVLGRPAGPTCIGAAGREQVAQARPLLRFVPVLSGSRRWLDRAPGLRPSGRDTDLPDLSGHQVYACGAPLMVEAAQRDFAAQWATGMSSSRTRSPRKQINTPDVRTALDTCRRIGHCPALLHGHAGVAPERLRRRTGSRPGRRAGRVATQLASLAPDGYSKVTAARYRFRRHGSFGAEGDQSPEAPHRAHWQPPSDYQRAATAALSAGLCPCCPRSRPPTSGRLNVYPANRSPTSSTAHGPGSSRRISSASTRVKASAARCGTPEMPTATALTWSRCSSSSGTVSRAAPRVFKPTVQRPALHADPALDRGAAGRRLRDPRDHAIQPAAAG